MSQAYLDEQKRLEDRFAQIAARTTAVEAQKKLLLSRLSTLNSIRIISYVALGMIGIAVILINVLLPLGWASALFSVGGVFVLGVSLTGLLRFRERVLNEQLQDKSFEEELLRSGASPEESRAEELLRMYQIQLRRYYDLNLTQNSWIFLIGILCIVLGVAVIAATFWRIANSTEPWQVKAVIGLVGTIGSLMTNYIAAVYLRMNSAITASLTTFHTTLASTHQLFLANLLISRIEEPKQRGDALALMSLAIAGKVSRSSTTAPKPKSKKPTKDPTQDDDRDG